MDTLTLRPVVADIFIKRRELMSLHTITLAVLGSIIIALSAQIAIPLPFTPVPISGQTFGVLLIGMLLGAKRGALSVFFYLIEGAMGLPVFAGLKGGLPHLIGPSGGYLIGFVLCAYVVGFLSERGWDRAILKTAIMMITGNIIIYFCGILWLSHYVGLSNAFIMGFIPFVVGDLIKIAFLMISMSLVWRLLNHRTT